MTKSFAQKNIRNILQLDFHTPKVRAEKIAEEVVTTLAGGGLQFEPEQHDARVGTNATEVRAELRAAK